MSFVEGTILCGNCGDSEEEHCLTCESCPGEPTKECCMEGWNEASKEYERQSWAAKAPAPDPGLPAGRTATAGTGETT